MIKQPTHTHTNTLPRGTPFYLVGCQRVDAYVGAHGVELRPEHWVPPDVCLVLHRKLLKVALELQQLVLHLLQGGPADLLTRRLELLLLFLSFDGGCVEC